MGCVSVGASFELSWCGHMLMVRVQAMVDREGRPATTAVLLPTSSHVLVPPSEEQNVKGVAQGLDSPFHIAAQTDRNAVHGDPANQSQKPSSFADVTPTKTSLPASSSATLERDMSMGSRKRGRDDQGPSLQRANETDSDPAVVALLNGEAVNDYLALVASSESDRNAIRRNEFRWLLSHPVEELEEQGSLPPRFFSPGSPLASRKTKEPPTHDSFLRCEILCG